MRIAILGTRGIPNNHGGFEQFAEYMSIGLTECGHSVFVYSSHNHPYQQKKWKNVKIIHQYDPEYKLGTAGQFIYDLNCIKDARKRSFDVILQLGYTSSSIWCWMLPKKSTIITNMDGLEWKRSKYSKFVRRFLREAEKWAINSSDYLIADSKGIKEYLVQTYNANSKYIPYGATLFSNPSFKSIDFTKTGRLSPYQYDMLIARIEPENNIEKILNAKINSINKFPLLVIGSTKNRFGKYLVDRFRENSQVIFCGAIYDINQLNNLRYYSNLYLHGHSVGGTNPSLLEAMASSALICAHNNSFNKAILEKNAFYFTSTSELTEVFNTIKKKDYQHFVDDNLLKIDSLYSWQVIIDEYEKYIQFAHKDFMKRY